MQYIFAYDAEYQSTPQVQVSLGYLPKFKRHTLINLYAVLLHLTEA